MSKKSNVFLSSAYNIYGLSGCKQCGFMGTDALNEYWQELQTIEIPASSCLTALNTDFHQTNQINKADNNSTSTRLIVSVWPVAPKCNSDCNKCTTCIANGNCKDEFVINTIGKKLFAEKYQKQEERND